MDRQEERDYYLNQLLGELFFEPWKKGEGDRKTLELQVTYDCNLNCKYCYVNRHGDDLYPREIRGSDDILGNTKSLLNWVEREGLQIPKWELFSGSLFSQEVGHKVVSLIYNKLKNTDKKKIRPDTIIIPSNMTFLMDKSTTKRVERYINDFRDIGVRLHFSCSVEGKYMEQNRPIKNTLTTGKSMGEHIFEPQERDDDYYHKLFKFAKRYNYGFHPMIYSDSIELWKKNFLWYQDMIEEYDMPHSRLFLLEVRNKEWSDKEIKEFREFVQFVHNWVYQNIAQGLKDKFINLIRDQKTINMVYSTIGSNRGDGMSCSIQKDLQVRLGDLHFGPCHRTSYKGFEFGKFKKDSGMITGIEALNTEMAMAIYGLDHETFPGCQTCMIRPICNKTCLGANLEDTGELFSPNPNVCQLNFARVLGALDFYTTHDMMGHIKAFANKRIAKTYKHLNEVSGGVE